VSASAADATRQARDTCARNTEPIRDLRIAVE